MTALIFDTELTDRKEGEIIEAAWLRFSDTDLFPGSDRIPEGLEVADGFYGRFKPTKPVTFGSMAVHHILPAELEGLPPSSAFTLPADTTYLIGHSIDTDWIAAGSAPHVKRICTHALSQHLWPDATGFSQVALLYMLLGASPSTRDIVRHAHGADVDVRNNLILLKHILRAKPEISTWSALWEYSEECRIPYYCPLKRWEGLKLEEMDGGAVSWCLNQSWLDPYFRKGLERVRAQRYAPVSDDVHKSPPNSREDVYPDDIPY